MKDICAAPGSRPLVGYRQRDGQRPLRSVRRRSLPLGLVTLTAVKELFEALTGASPKVGMRGTAAAALPRGTFAIPTTASPPREIAVSTHCSLPPLQTRRHKAVSGIWRRARQRVREVDEWLIGARRTVLPQSASTPAAAINAAPRCWISRAEWTR